MRAIELVTIEVADPVAAETFYASAFRLTDRVRVRGSDAPSTGFRGFTVSLVVPQPSTVDGLVGRAREAGGTVLKPAVQIALGLRGCRAGALTDPDGFVWEAAAG
jgi:hypothetical protein